MIHFDGHVLLLLARATDGEGGASYVYGTVRPFKDPGVYRWTGERRWQAFTRVANSFEEWLNLVLTFKERL